MTHTGHGEAFLEKMGHVKSYAIGPDNSGNATPPLKFFIAGKNLNGHPSRPLHFQRKENAMFICVLDEGTINKKPKIFLSDRLFRTIPCKTSIGCLPHGPLVALRPIGVQSWRALTPQRWD
jgi:hypothetical protein